MPLTAKAFLDYRSGGAQLSDKALQAVRRMLVGDKLEREDVGMSAREWRELKELLATKVDE